MHINHIDTAAQWWSFQEWNYNISNEFKRHPRFLPAMCFSAPHQRFDADIQLQGVWHLTGMTASINAWKEENIPKKGIEKVPVEQQGLHLNWLHVITPKPSKAKWPIHDTSWYWKFGYQTRHKHFFQEHLFVQPFPRAMQKSSVDSHRDQIRQADRPSFSMFCSPEISIARRCQAMPGHPVTMKGALRASFWTCTTMPALAQHPGSAHIPPDCDRIAPTWLNTEAIPRGHSFFVYDHLIESNIQFHAMKIGSFPVRWLDNAW